MAGALVGVFSLLLTRWGNPANMGLCIVCFLRDTAGALGLHGAEQVQYIRPEIIGITLGAFLMAQKGGEFKPKGGSAPLTRFVLGIFVVQGALMFLGCPLRMVLRLAGGDLNALLGLAGFAAGIFVGVSSLKRGFTLQRTYKLKKAEGYLFPALQVFLLLLLVLKPTYVFFSRTGPGSLRAPIFLSLLAGLLIGLAAQRTRLCLVGGLRDLVMFQDGHLLAGFAALFAVAFLGNLLLGNFNLGFLEQAGAHSDGVWNFLGMALAGLGSVFLGGCPLRQIILAAEGNTDSALAFLGMLVGAALAHNFGLAATAAGPTVNGQIAVILGLLTLLALGYLNRENVEEIKMKGEVPIDA